MAVKMRLRREGKKKQPFYRIVVADARSPRDGRFIEDIGFYQPLHDPSTIQIDRERALYWLRNGVQPSEAVANLLRIQGIWGEFRPNDRRGLSQAQQAAKDAAAQGEPPTTRPQPKQAAPKPAPATSPLEEAPAEAVEQAVTEDTQPAPGPPEERGAIPEGSEPDGAEGDQP
jgi:small subunit ribosomal protein S16